MPDYRKRKRNKIFSSPQRVKKSRIKRQEPAENIEMTSQRSKKSETVTHGMKVVKGKKLEQKRKLRILIPSIAAILVIITVLQLILPAGLIETVANSIALLGSGGYPIELESTDTVNTVSKGSYYYVLTDTKINAFANSGKQLFSYAHGFDNPVMKTSQTRIIVFNQGGNSALVFDLNDLKSEIITEKPIITAGISDSGTYALVTRSDKYASAVSVYNKRNKKLYEWYSAEDTVNNVAISPNGKKIAVSTFNSNIGQYNSELRVLSYDSANAEYVKTFDNTLVYSLDSTHKTVFAVVTANGVQFIKWSKFKTTEYKNEYNTAFFRAGKGGFVAVYNRESDKTDNRIVLFTKSGEVKAELQYNGIISDIDISGGHIYCMSDTEIHLLDNEGKVLRKASCGFGAVNLSVTGTNKVAVITDNKIEKIGLDS